MLFSTPLPYSSKLRCNIRNSYLGNESLILEKLLPLAQLDKNALSRVSATALKLAKGARIAAQSGSGIQNLLNEYALSTQEGVVLMCLAEALLRVPDSTTADRLIRDKLISGDWQSHIGNSDSLFVNCSAWGLLISGQVVSFNEEERHNQVNRLKKVVGTIGEPIIRKAMRQAMGIMGTQFVLGRSIEEATQKARKEEARNYRYSYDMLGEGARTMMDADIYFKSYSKAIAQIGKVAKGKGIYQGAGISVKLSAIHPRYEFAKRDRVMAELVPRLKSLALMAKKQKIGLTVDAEEADRLDLSLDIFEAVYSDPDLDGWEGFGLVVQAYQKRALPTLNWVIDLSQAVGRKIMLRLVKGAYWDSEIKRAQVDGLEGYPVYTRKASTDVSYQACAGLLLDNREFVFPQFATHNAYSVAYILERATKSLDGFEFQRLHGMGEGLYDSLMKAHNIPVRIYAPVGEHVSLLAYLVRRLLENGANTSFVHNITDDKIPLESLVEDPVSKISHWQQITNPNISLPSTIYGSERNNSRGIDLTHRPNLEALTKTTQTLRANRLKHPIIPEGNDLVSTNPADTRDILGALPKTNKEGLKTTLDKANTAFLSWSSTPINVRATYIERLADTLEKHQDELIAMCTEEAGKTTADGVAEVREAVDFCRFYANEGRKVCSPHSEWGVDGKLESRGVVVCISPWNFPLAIFLGQVSAALVAGNAVLAKPADSTCLIAARVLELMDDCGFPRDVTQLVLIPGSTVGELLLPDERIAAVMFTGSTAVGAGIAKTLSARPGPRIPLIAETGGQNCMLVDSTALPEQVVDDVIASGFQSAGQRCSALRVLFLQEDIADNIIEMIIGAMRELHVGDPGFLHTDVGPVIDKKALKALENHVAYMENRGKLLYQCPLSTECEHGTFFAPRLYEIDSIDVLSQEVFGPVVHIVRYKAENLNQAIDAINSTGFGLTAGIHSRVQTTCDQFSRKVDAGNIYVNRNTIGAVVGVQPFGGHGLSGTGPKAGGPAYVYRLMDKKDSMSRSTWLGDFDFLGNKVIDRKIKPVKQAKISWSETDIEQRANAIEIWINALIEDPSIGLPLTLKSQVHTMIAEARSNQVEPTTLPGPTGELNQLIMKARGTILCLQKGDDTMPDSIRQIVAALLCGNKVIHLSSCQFDFGKHIQAAGIHDAYQRANPSSERELQTQLLTSSLNGVAICAPPELVNWVDNILMKREGPLTPLIIENTGPTLMHRFVIEKVISNDTTASGGNASLLAMGDGSE